MDKFLGLSPPAAPGTSSLESLLAQGQAKNKTRGQKKAEKAGTPITRDNWEHSTDVAPNWEEMDQMNAHYVAAVDIHNSDRRQANSKSTGWRLDKDSGKKVYHTFRGGKKVVMEGGSAHMAFMSDNPEIARKKKEEAKKKTPTSSSSSSHVKGNEGILGNDNPSVRGANTGEKRALPALAMGYGILDMETGANNANSWTNTEGAVSTKAVKNKRYKEFKDVSSSSLPAPVPLQQEQEQETPLNQNLPSSGSGRLSSSRFGLPVYPSTWEPEGLGGSSKVLFNAHNQVSRQGTRIDQTGLDWTAYLFLNKEDTSKRFGLSSLMCYLLCLNHLH